MNSHSRWFLAIKNIHLSFLRHVGTERKRKKKTMKEEARVQPKKDSSGRVTSQWLSYQIENWLNKSFYLSQG